MKKVLFGNCFPKRLIQRPARIVPVDPESISDHITKNSLDLVSFWTKPSSYNVVRETFGIDPEPENWRRTSIKLNDDGYPTLNGETFDLVLVLEPNFYESIIKTSNPPDQIKKEHVEDWYACIIFFDDDL